jgi:hypothetical protein
MVSTPSSLVHTHGPRLSFDGTAPPLPIRQALSRNSRTAVLGLCLLLALTISVEVLILAFILRSSLTWPRTHSDAADVATADRLQQQAHA